MEPNLEVFTDEEFKAIMDQVYELEVQCRVDEARALRDTLPMTPLLANHAKKKFGIKMLIESGANLSRAVERYGLEWLKEDN